MDQQEHLKIDVYILKYIAQWLSMKMEKPNQFIILFNYVI